MPEPYQPSSPEEKSLLEEHIVFHSASDKISGHLCGTASAGTSETMAFGENGSSSANNTPPFANRHSRSQEMLSSTPPMSAAFPARGYQQSSDRPAITSAIASAPGNPSPTSPASSALFSRSMPSDPYPHFHPLQHTHTQSYSEFPSSRQPSNQRLYRPYHKPTSQHRSREANSYAYVDMHYHSSQHPSHQQIEQQPSEAYIHSNHMAVDWNLSNELPQYARHPYTASLSGRAPVSALSMPRSCTVHSATNMASPATSAGFAAINTPMRGLTAEEKEMRRKVSHSAIEKRRRERTNAVLRSLQDMVPGLPKSGKIQKLEILEAAAEHILQLTAQANDSVQSTTNIGRLRRTNSKRLVYQQPGSTYTYEHYSGHGPQYDKSGARAEPDDTQSPGNVMPFVHPPQESNTRLTNIASPVSVASDATRDGSGEDTLANPGDMSDSPDSIPLASDPSSMKVNFLLC
ncbi:hypothetical protein H4R20_005246 [Coemansia guatemalensis]|uniref:BHLH domain-containing protein n=1 Tax=Coemansia guatemalensis TaxID=2761395 RepID=A0A9W8HW08_9FUNG|nr:hypothetical protein H4R20_005246 [Coemansia guatemalensis]